MLKKIWINILAWRWLLVGSFLLSVCFQNKALAGAAESIQVIEEMVVPLVKQSTEWGVKAGLGLVGASAFYALVVRTIRMGD